MLYMHVDREPDWIRKTIQDSRKENISLCWWFLLTFKIPPWLLFYQDLDSFQITCTQSFFPNYTSRPTSLKDAICWCWPRGKQNIWGLAPTEISVTHITGDYVISRWCVSQIGFVYYQVWLKLKEELVSKSTNGKKFVCKCIKMVLPETPT